MSPPDAPEPAAPVSRRGVLRVGGGGVLALVIGGVAGWADRRGGDSANAPTSTTTSPTTTSSSTTAPPVVVRELGEVDAGIVALGQRVIATTGDDDLDTLLRSLPAAGDDPLGRAAAVTGREFAAGDTVVVDGWVLAVSEARAAAVVALLCEDAAC